MGHRAVSGVQFTHFATLLALGVVITSLEQTYTVHETSPLKFTACKADAPCPAMMSELDEACTRRQTAAPDVPEFDWDLGDEKSPEQPASISVGA